MQQVLMILGDLDAPWKGSNEVVGDAELIIRFDPAKSTARVVKDRRAVAPYPVTVAVANGGVIHAR